MFRNAEVGDRVYDMLKGWGMISSIEPKEEYPIHFIADIESFSKFTFDGKRNKRDKNPTLFWDEIKFEIPEKPFDFKEFIRDNLKIKQFIPHEKNYYLIWDNNSKEVIYDISIGWEYFQPYFLKDNIELVVSTLNEKGITKEEFQSIIKELYM